VFVVAVVWFIFVAVMTIYTQPRPIVSFIQRRFNVLFFVNQPPHTRRKLVALTIDDGLSSSTPAILDLLSQYKARATFFLIGSHVNKFNHQETSCSSRFFEDISHKRNTPHTHSSLLERLACEKMEIGNHMMYDEASIKLTENEFKNQLSETERIIFQNQEEENDNKDDKKKCFRPGCGFFNQRMLSIVESFGYRTVLGDVYPFDPQIRLPTLNAIYILRQVVPGSIIIIHDRPYTIETLKQILPELTEKGFEITTVSDLLESYNHK